MAIEKKKDNFISGISDFFKRVNNQDIIKTGSNSIQTYDSVKSPRELEKNK